MIAYSIIAAARTPQIAEIVVNFPFDYEERTENIMKSYAAGKPYKLVRGGQDRQSSSRLLCEAAEQDVVVIHEAARPMITPEVLHELIEAPAENAGFCAPISFSMCRVDPRNGAVTEGVDRDTTLNVQLPQKFKRDTIRAAHEATKLATRRYTEDAVMCVEANKTLFYALPGQARNLKVTTREDFRLAAELLRETRS